MTEEHQQHPTLSNTQFQQAQLLFTQANQLPHHQRNHWLEQQTADPVVIEKVRQLLDISNQPQQHSTHKPISAIDMLELALIESELGKYQLTKSLGEGGMGRVYLARRNDQAFDKDVVIKLMKGFHKKDSTLQRFHFERQVLAKMEHSNIARLLDGGECQDGTPFYVMEYVDGSNLIEYSRQHQLNLNQRLGLFQKICAAVHYAHQNLIIHRDLKPSNILINQEGEPKLLDFGIAKRLSDDSAALTQTAMHPMTPAYSSPEQILGKHLTTASDVYSLGMILFEILAGQSPYDEYNTDPLRLKVAICEHEPEAPSKLNSRSKLRWSRDLDNIVLKTLRKDPTRRYRSVLQLSDDIQRYRDGHPVSASRNTWLYRGTKLLFRHRWAAAGILLAVVLLAAQQIRVLQQRDQAQLNAQRAEQNRDFLINMFDTLDPNVSQQIDISAKAVLDHGARQLDNSLLDQPELRAELMTTLASLYQQHGLFQEAATLAENAINIKQSLYLDQSPELAETLNTLANTYIHQGLNNKALSIAQKSLNILKPHQQQYLEDYVFALNILSLAHLNSGQLETSRQVSERSVAIARTLQDKNPELLVETLEIFGLADFYLDNYKDAEQTFLESLTICNNYLEKMHIIRASINNNLGSVLAEQGLYEKAEDHHRQALAIITKTLGEEHPDVAFIQNTLGLLLQNTGRFEEAEAAFKNSLQLMEQTIGTEHTKFITTLGNLALLYRETNRLEQALELAYQALEIQQKIAPDNLDQIAIRQYVVALTLSALQRFELAEQMYLTVIAIWINTRGKNSNDLATARSSLATMLARQEKYPQAEMQMRSALVIYQQKLAPEHWHIAVVNYSLGNIVMQQGRFGEAESLLVPACDRLFEAKSIQSRYTRNCYKFIIELYRKTDRLAEAEPYQKQLDNTESGQLG